MTLFRIFRISKRVYKHKRNLGHASFILWNLKTRNYVQSQQTFVDLLNVSRTSSRHFFKMFTRRLQRNNFSSSKTSLRRLKDVLEINKLLWVKKNPFSNYNRENNLEYVLIVDGSGTRFSLMSLLIPF